MKRKEKGKNLNPISRRFCFTIYPENLPYECFQETSKIEWDKIEDKAEFIRKRIDRDKVTEILTLTQTRGLVWSLEEGDTKEHAHIQGYCELDRPMRLFRFSNLYAWMKAHTEKAEGDRDANIAYITHTGKHKDKGTLHFFVQVGKWPMTGGYEKNTSDEAVRMILDGYSVPEVLSLFGGSMLWAVSNLQKLADSVNQTAWEKEERKKAYLRWRMAERPEDYEETPF